MVKRRYLLSKKSDAYWTHFQTTVFQTKIFRIPIDLSKSNFGLGVSVFLFACVTHEMKRKTKLIPFGNFTKQVEQFIFQLKHQRIHFALLGFLEINYPFVLAVGFISLQVKIISQYTKNSISEHWRNSHIFDHFDTVFDLKSSSRNQHPKQYNPWLDLYFSFSKLVFIQCRQESNIKNIEH